MTETNSERAIGRLEGKVDALVSVIEDQTEKSDRRSARIYQELEQIRLDAAQSRRDVSDLKSRLDADAPTITEIKKWKERFIGMQMLWAFISATVGAAIALSWKWLVANLTGK